MSKNKNPLNLKKTVFQCTLRQAIWLPTLLRTNYMHPDGKPARSCHWTSIFFPSVLKNNEGLQMRRSPWFFTLYYSQGSLKHVSLKVQLSVHFKKHPSRVRGNFRNDFKSHKKKATCELSEQRLSKWRLDRGMGGALKEKHIVSKTVGTLHSWVFPLDFPGLIRCPRTLVHLFPGSHSSIWLKHQICPGSFFATHGTQCG